MKKIILGLSLSSYILFAYSIEVNIVNINKDKKGQIVVGLFKDAKSFTKVKQTYKSIVIPNVSSDSIQLTFSNLESGEYAIALFHDKNSNLKLDTNLFGIPKEGYGFSKNIRHKFRKINFSEAKFDLTRIM